MKVNLLIVTAQQQPHKPINKTNKTVVGLRQSNHWEPPTQTQNCMKEPKPSRTWKTKFVRLYD